VQAGSDCTWFGKQTPCSLYRTLAIFVGIFTGIDFAISLVILIVFAGWIRTIKQRYPGCGAPPSVYSSKLT
jgi:hypothetical protein